MILPGLFSSIKESVKFLATEEGQSYIKNIPMKRLGLESDLDGVLLLLSSDASAFMTGSIIPVDGGHLINPL